MSIRKNLEVCRQIETHTEKSSLAPCVAKHLLHATVLQRVGVLANKLIFTGWVELATTFGFQQYVREQEKHLVLSICPFMRNHL